ncbi:MAG: Peptidyl-tRNA hydrolase [Parcubacteria group bacterium GW2011_GWA2_47_10b]|nr:MAG: Peptidyl-tRNA hydrolase [Parcubacteria group bacterium GW2011_GWA2_47_10b]
MKTIVGLGNPGKEYEGTRHNIGRETVAAIAKHFDFEPWQENKKFFGLTATGAINKPRRKVGAPTSLSKNINSASGEKVLLVLPDTYMNKSGKALAQAGVKPKDLVVIHDDTDLVLGSFKVSFGKRSAGHKGVESVMRAVKSRDFWRVRVGVQKKKRVDAMELVLKKWAPSEKLIVKKIEKKILELIEEPLSVTTISQS